MTADAQAIQLGFCGKIDNLDKSELYPAALFKDDKAGGRRQLTGTGFDRITTKTFKDKGWATPTSWNDPQGPGSSRSSGDPADQQHLRALHADDVRPAERRRREEHRAGLQG